MGLLVGPPSKSSLYRLCFRLGGSALAIGLAIWLLDWHTLLDLTARLSMSALLAATCLIVASQIIVAVRWAYLASHGLAVDFPQQIVVYFRSAMLSLVTPGSIGGDAYRALAVHQAGAPLEAGLAAVLLDRSIGVGALGVFGAATLPLLSSAASAGELKTALQIGLAVLGLFGIVGWLAVRQLGGAAPSAGGSKWRTSLSKFLAGFLVFPPRRLAWAAVLALAASGTWFASLIICSNAMQVGVASSTVVIGAIVAELARLLPISVQGIGVREGSFASIVAVLGGVPEAAFAAAAVAYLLNMVAIIGLGTLALHCAWFEPDHASKQES